jgi:succinate-semialdehyde dehydrogenase / glutarate-semialdehyde dehydrogenase
MMAIATVNPATGETIRTFSALTDAEVEIKLELAQQTFTQYQQTSLEERAKSLNQAAEILENERERLAALATLEMGKTYTSAIAEVEKCALACRYYAEHGAQFLADIPVSTDGTKSWVRFEPVGPVLAVMPWNFPYWQVFRFAAPALMAGNVGLLKHASNVPQCALAIEEVFHRAGFMPGAFQTLLIPAEKVSSLVADPRVKAVTLTGSEPAGRQVASMAGQHLKKTVLELGGSDPFIVLDSANIEQAVSTAVKARMLNNGQSCIAAKRFIVTEKMAGSFEKAFVAKFQGLKIGDPMDPATDLGPLATPQILDDLEKQVQESLHKGASLLTGGHRITALSGNYYEPTILTNISKDSPGYAEELFGPVASLFRVSNVQEAIQLANDTAFGLGSSAWTQDPEEQQMLIEQLQVGSVFINGMVKSDPRLPFGGTKNSGYGRELSVQGMHEFVNIKTVWVQ